MQLHVNEITSESKSIINRKLLFIIVFYVEMLINSQELELYSRTNELLRVQSNIMNIEIFSMKSYLGL